MSPVSHIWRVALNRISTVLYDDVLTAYNKNNTTKITLSRPDNESYIYIYNIIVVIILQLACLGPNQESSKQEVHKFIQERNQLRSRLIERNGEVKKLQDKLSKASKGREASPDQRVAELQVLKVGVVTNYDIMIIELKVGVVTSYDIMIIAFVW